MFRGTSVVALIPARGGSKGLPRKNLVPLNGMPLIQYTISAASMCSFVDDVIVSTDDTEIASVAKRLGSSVHARSVDASTDESTAADVVADYLKSRDAASQFWIVYLQPTSPLRNSTHLDDAFRTFEGTSATSLVSVRVEDQSPYKSLRILDGDIVQPLFDDATAAANRQALPRTVRPNGAIYIFSVVDFLKCGAIPISGSLGYIMGGPESVDVDSDLDLQLALKEIQSRD